MGKCGEGCAACSKRRCSARRPRARARQRAAHLAPQPQALGGVGHGGGQLLARLLASKGAPGAAGSQAGRAQCARQVQAPLAGGGAAGAVRVCWRDWTQWTGTDLGLQIGLSGVLPGPAFGEQRGGSASVHLSGDKWGKWRPRSHPRLKFTHARSYFVSVSSTCAPGSDLKQACAVPRAPSQQPLSSVVRCGCQTIPRARVQRLGPHARGSVQLRRRAQPATRARPLLTAEPTATRTCHWLRRRPHPRPATVCLTAGRHLSFAAAERRRRSLRRRA